MNKYMSAILLAGSLLAVPVTSRASTVTMTATDAFNETSFNAGLHWSDSTAPTNGNDYLVEGDGIRLRTPPDGNNYTFGGDSLTLSANGAANSTYGLTYKGNGSTITIDNLIMQTGGQINALNGSDTPLNLDGSLDIAGDCSIYAKQGPINILAPISGSATITNPGADNSLTILSFMSSSNTYTGSIVNNGRFALADGGNMNFVIGASGVNNSVSGTGASSAFNGVIVFDLSGAGDAIGDSWTLVSAANKSFGATFSVDGFSDAGDDTWYKVIDATKRYSFDEATGILSVIAPPALTLGPTSPADGAVHVSATPTLIAYFVDDNETVNLGSAMMTIDGGSVTPDSVSYSSPTTEVSYTVSTPFAQLTTHTAKVVVASTPGGSLYTNEWTFTTDVIGEYFPAGYTLYEDFESYPDSGGSFTQGVTTAGKWLYVEGTSVASNGLVTTHGDIVDSAGDAFARFGWTGGQCGFISDTPDIDEDSEGSFFMRLKTADSTPDCMFGLSDMAYTNTTGWDYPSFEVQLGLTGSGNLTARQSSGATNILTGVPLDTWVNLRLDVHNRAGDTNDTYDVYASYGGDAPALIASNLTFRNGTTNSLSTFFTRSNTPQTERTAGLDDIYFLGTGPAFAPTINSIAVAGGMVTINWDSDITGTYQIESKSSLTSPTWTPVGGATGLTGGTGQSTAFSVSGDPAEFFRISGE